ncbi:hypothetical protein AB1Y20_013863 [Prymnesium parvum]|uniref:peptidylprolyl isomerase n=1 Tax=Prymnesium parvum TaxID=97485 RepID=A0AB34IHN5_PRYPA
MLSPLPLLAALLLPSPPTPPPRALGRRDAILSGASLAALAAAPGGALAATQRKFYVTDGGVKYFDLQEGECKLFNVACTPRRGDLVKIKYKAFLSNGKMFDSSEGPGRKPLAAKFGSGVLLPGWEEAMETMKEGGTRVIQVPPKLAYGEKGVRIETKDGSVEYLVPPNETLQFELTLLQVAAPPP